MMDIYLKSTKDNKKSIKKKYKINKNINSHSVNNKISNYSHKSLLKIMNKFNDFKNKKNENLFKT